MVQLVEQVEPVKMFNEEYTFFSSTFTRMTTHFKQLADLVMENYIKSSDPFVVEIGRNKGIMLQHFSNAGLCHLGVETYQNVTQVAIGKASKRFVNSLT